MINELKNELRKSLESYNNYEVMGFKEEHDIDSEPVSIYEYYDNEYQLEKNKEYCGNCGKEKEDYESYLCDNCWEEERRLYEDEETIIPLKCVGVRDLKDNNGLKITLIDMNDEILNTFEFNIDIKRLNDMELYNLCYAISNRVNSLYYEYDGNLEREQVLNVVKEELVK